MDDSHGSEQDKRIGRPSDDAAGACPDYRTFSPRTLIALQPGAAAVEITVPNENINAVRRSYPVDSGGIGALFNYRGYAMNSHSGNVVGSGYFYRYLDTTTGFNAGDWLFRSHQDYSSSNGFGTLTWRSAYVQKTFEAQKQVLQAGRITIRDPFFGGLPTTGIQWFPEQALYSRGGIFPVTGLASTRSRVEIRQSGVLLFTTLVPGGPFSIDDYPLSNRGADLSVSVIDESGSEQVFSVPASSLQLASSNTRFEGWNLSAGRYWDQTQQHIFQEEPLATASHGWAHGNLTGAVGGLASTHYASLGTSIGANFPEQKVDVFGQLMAGRDAGNGLNGIIASAAAGKDLNRDVKLGLSANARSQSYRSLQETLAYEQVAPFSAYGSRSQLATTLSWNAGWFGGVSIGLTQENYFSGEPGRSVNLNWNKTWNGGISLSVGASHRPARLSPLDVLNPQTGDLRISSSNYAYVSLSIPLGKGATSRTTLQRTDGLQRFNTGVEQNINRFFGYRASVDAVNGPDGRSDGTSLSAYGTPYYTSFGVGVSRVRNYDSAFAETSGGVLMTRDGVAFTPYQIQDSFGILRTGDVVGARIETSQGPVWSGPAGLAAIADFAPYQESRLELTGSSIPIDVEADNGLQIVQASRGAVLNLDMNMRRIHRILLIVTMADGSLLPAGATVVRGDSEYLTTSIVGGKVLTSNWKSSDKLWVDIEPGRRCIIEDVVPEKKNDGDIFERASAICR